MADLPFHKEFQATVVALLWRTPGLISKYMDKLPQASFEDAQDATVIGYLYRHYKDHKKSPAKSTLLEYIRQAYPEKNNDLHTRSIAALALKLDTFETLDISDKPFIEDQVKAFIQYESLKAFVLDTVAKVQRKEYDPNLPKLCRQALDAGIQDDDLGMDWIGNTMGRIANAINPEHEPRIPTGITHLDSLINGGLKAGELGILLGLPKGFKSGTLLNFAASALKVSNGQNVAYISLELDEDLVGLRFDYNASRLSRKVLMEDPERFLKVLRTRQDILYGNGKLFIKFFKTKTATCDTIRLYIDKLQEHIKGKIGLLIVDYLDLLKATKKREKSYQEDVDICEDLRELGNEYRFPVWTACRATREAVGKKRISMAHMSRAFERVGVADLMVALCVQRDQRVITNEGSIKIGDIHCRLKKDPTPLLALSHNFEKGTDEWKPIVNWFHNGYATEPFVRIKTDACVPGKRLCISPGSTTTKEHHYFWPDGSKVVAGDLNIGDFISGHAYQHSYDQRQVLLGTLLGDGSIRADGTITVEHGLSQAYYLRWKQKVFHTLSTSVTQIKRAEARRGKYILKARASQMLTVRGSTEALRLREIFYPMGKKIVPRDLLESISELGMAVWFMDDGSIRRKTSQISLHTEGYTKEDCDFLVDWFARKWGWIGKLSQNNVIVFNADSARKIMYSLSKYLVRNTKSGRETKNFLCPKTEQGYIGKCPVRVLSVKQVAYTGQKYHRAKIDIEVEGNHNYYLASGSLVSNCQTEKEKAAKIMRLYLAATRNSEGEKMVTCNVDYERMTIKSEGVSEVEYEEEGEARHKKRPEQANWDEPARS